MTTNTLDGANGTVAEHTSLRALFVKYGLTEEQADRVARAAGKPRVRVHVMTHSDAAQTLALLARAR